MDQNLSATVDQSDSSIQERCVINCIRAHLILWIETHIPVTLLTMMVCVVSCIFREFYPCRSSV